MLRAVISFFPIDLIRSCPCGVCIAAWSGNMLLIFSSKLIIELVWEKSFFTRACAFLWPLISRSPFLCIVSACIWTFLDSALSLSIIDQAVPVFAIRNRVPSIIPTITAAHIRIKAHIVIKSIKDHKKLTILVEKITVPVIAIAKRFAYFLLSLNI